MDDFNLDDLGSICLLHAVSKAAVEWVEEHIPSDAMTSPCGGTVIEHRYVAPIVEGILADGLSIS
jgi:hypothetical protein